MIKGIIQARMGSTRLPGKVLMKLGDRTLMEWCIQRLQKSTFVNEWIVATTDQAEDDAIENLCNLLQITCYRGSEWDVLDRFYQAIVAHKKIPQTVVRICCDNPTHHGEVVDFTIKEYQRYQLDYFSNGNQGPHYYEDGITSEVFSFQALETSWKNATLLSQREHVTPYIKTSGKFSCGWRKFRSDFDFKLSVDTPNDLLLNETIFERLGGDFTIATLSDFLIAHPELIKINLNSEKGAGYKKSLNEDKKVK